MLGYKFRGVTAVNRRRDRRIPVSLPAKVNGETVLLKDISLGDDVLVDLHIREIGHVNIGASVVRTDGKCEYGVAFMGLSSDAFKLIENLEMGQYRRLLKVA